MKYRYGKCCFPLYCRRQDPVFEDPPMKYSAEHIIKILLDPDINRAKVCKERPLSIEKSSTFVIDLDCLQDPEDVKKDNFGIWNHSGSHNIPFECQISDDGTVHIGRGVLSNQENYKHYYLRRLHSTHPSNRAFRRMIALITGWYFIATNLSVCI